MVSQYGDHSEYSKRIGQMVECFVRNHGTVIEAYVIVVEVEKIETRTINIDAWSLVTVIS